MAASVSTALSHATDPHRAAIELATGLKSTTKPRAVIVYSGVGIDTDGLRRELAQSFEGTALVGCTSCLGAGRDGKFDSDPIVSAMALNGEGFRVGTACLPKAGMDPVALGRKLATAALANAGFEPKATRFAILHTTPGAEESILAGIRDVLGTHVPMIGGSAADNDLSGKWSVWNETTAAGDGATLAVCDWPWKFVMAFESGYMPWGVTGMVTRAQGRLLQEIDSQPAAEVYNRWTEGAIASELKTGGQVLAKTTLKPLGISRGKRGGFDNYLLIHPESVRVADKSLALFAEVHQGESLALMHSTQGALVSRASRVADRALLTADLKQEQILGGLLIYCGGCLLAIKDHVGEAMQDFGNKLHAPFVAAFTFGEIGCVVPGKVDHGNLMAGVLLLSGEHDNHR